jgi:hypothetical protein
MMVLADEPNAVDATTREACRFEKKRVMLSLAMDTCAKLEATSISVSHPSLATAYLMGMYQSKHFKHLQKFGAASCAHIYSRTHTPLVCSPFKPPRTQMQMQRPSKFNRYDESLSVRYFPHA